MLGPLRTVTFNLSDIYMLSAKPLAEKKVRQIPINTICLSCIFINGTLPDVSLTILPILQYFVKIANYANNVFKNVATYVNLNTVFVYLSKFINNL